MLITSLPQSLLDALAGSATTAAVPDLNNERSKSHAVVTSEAVVEEDTGDGHITVADVDSDEDEGPTRLGSLTCKACGEGVAFESVADQRAHFRSDWHRYNQTKRLPKGMAPLSEHDFDALEEVSSIEASDDDDDEEYGNDDKDQEEDEADARERRTIDLSTPFFNLLIPASVLAQTSKVAPESAQADTSSEPRKVVQIYKRVLFSKNDMRTGTLAASGDVATIIDKLKSLQITQRGAGLHWTLMMLGAGHFAGAVFPCSVAGSATEFKPMMHKTFHRYTTRRKQGGAQSGNDGAKGKANSAGAMLRRYNESALQDEVQALLREWADIIKSSALIFLHVPPRARNTIFFDDNILSFKDPRVRNFPFITKRPTLAELTRCFMELITLRVKDIDEVTVAQPATPPRKVVAKKKENSPNAAASRHQQEPPKKPALYDHTTKLIDLARRGKTESLRAVLASEASTPADLGPIEDPSVTSLLHVAASSQSSSPETIALLLSLGADPTLRDARGKTPYELSDDRDYRDAFRRAFAAVPEKWDWIGMARVPSMLTPEMEQRQREKEREKKKRMKEKQKAAAPPPPPPPDPAVEAAAKAAAQAEEARRAERAKKASVLGRLAQAERQSLGLAPEVRARIEREKRALAAEARIKSAQGKCAFCSQPLVPGQIFEKMVFKYCSMECCKDDAFMQ